MPAINELLNDINTAIQLLRCCLFKCLPIAGIRTKTLYMDGCFPIARSATGIPDFVSWMFAAWTITASKLPIVSTTISRLRPFVFSHRQYRVLLLLLSFSGSVNQWSHSLAQLFGCLLHKWCSPVPSGDSPTTHFWQRHDKSWIPSYMEENHAVNYAICSRYLPDTAQHRPIPVFPICFCSGTGKERRYDLPLTPTGRLRILDAHSL